MDHISLLSSGFLPKELPPPYSSKPFAEYMADQTNLVVDVPEHVDKKKRRLLTCPVSHILGRPGGVRRRLQIPNPFNYYKLCRVIKEAWFDITLHFLQSGLSKSHPTEDDSGARAVVPSHMWNELPELRAGHRASNKYILHTDISRFYPSIYTHTLSWALDGKTKAKQNKFGNSLGNTIDILIREGQDGQSLGVPIGPDTSLIVAEIIASSIDQNLQEHTRSGFRHFDDYEFSFSSRDEAEEMLAVIERELSYFELATNPLKTHILEGPQPITDVWSVALQNYPIPKYGKITARQLIEYFSFAFDLASKNTDKPVISFSISLLNPDSIDIDDWGLFQNLLAQSVLIEPSSFHRIIPFFDHMKDGGISEAFTSVVNDLIIQKSRLEIGSEVAWALYFAIRFKIELSEEASDALVNTNDAIVRVLACSAAFDVSLFRGNRMLNEWKAHLTPNSLYQEHWIFSYEAVAQGWVEGDYASFVGDDQNFGPMLRAGVKFLDLERDAEEPESGDYQG